MDLLVRFIDECKRVRRWKAGEPVVLALSGGVDSMVLYHLLLRLPDEMRPHVCVAHVNHQLRPESDHEEEELHKMAAAEKSPFFSRRWPKPAHPKSGIEEAARAFRYAFFEHVMETTESGVLLTAHHRGDQLETVLMRFVRGGQLERMIGIRRIRPFGKGQLCRPLLSFSKEELYAYAEEQGIPYFEDPTNRELMYTRNRYRNTVIPLLKQENPSVEEQVDEFAQDLEDVLQLVSPLVSQALARIKQIENTGPALSREGLLELDLPLQRFVLAGWLQEELTKGGEPISVSLKRNQVTHMLQWIREGGPNSRLDLPRSYSLKRRYDTLQVVHEEKKEASSREPVALSLSPGEWKKLPDGSRMGLYATDQFQYQPEGEAAWIYLDPDTLQLPLTIRNRKPGDRMTLKGMQGTKKVKDIFIDQKVPASKRDEAYVVTDAGGEILWLVKFKESSLSIKLETDTIQYILIFEPSL